MLGAITATGWVSVECWICWPVWICRQRPVVMGIALRPYLMGQAHRFAHLERALTHLKERAGAETWFTTPGRIARHYAGLDLG